MNRQELIKAIRKAPVVYANVRLTEHDCWYVQVVKCNLLETLPHSEQVTFNAVVREDGTLYLD